MSRGLLNSRDSSPTGLTALRLGRWLAIGALVLVTGEAQAQFAYQAQSPFQFVNYEGALVEFAMPFSVRAERSWFPPPTTGYSLAVGNDPVIVQPVGVVPLGNLAELHGGAGPDVFLVTLEPEGWGVSVVYDLLSVESVMLETYYLEHLEVTYRSTPDTPADGGYSDLGSSDAIGTPPVANEVMALTQVYPLAFYEGGILLRPPTPEFRRGDCNSDGTFNIADMIRALLVLFQGDSAGCLKSCDMNDDGAFDLGDPIYGLSSLWGPGSPPVPTPHTYCGLDPTEDFLECENPACP